MARARRIDPTPLARSQVRAGIRSGESHNIIADAVIERHPNVNRTKLNAMIRQEARRQAAVNTIMGTRKTASVDLRTLTGCTSPSQSVRARITVTFDDPDRGRKTYGQTVELQRTSGQLFRSLNPAIEQVLADARGRGYQPPAITSADTAPPDALGYRIEYIECT